MRLRPSIALAALASLGLSSPAQAWKTDAFVEAGPALAGSGTAWAESGSHNPITVRRAPLDGAPTTLFTLPRPASCDRVEDIAASAELVAVEVVRTPGGYSCDTASVEIVVSDPAGGAKVLETSADGCAPDGMDVDGTTVAVARVGCPVKLYDVAAGTTRTLALEVPPYHWVHGIRMAGKYVAVATGTLNGPHSKVVVWNRETDQMAYEVDGATILDNPGDASGAAIALQGDGRLLVGVRVPGTEDGSTRYGRASADDPVLRRITGYFDTPLDRIAYAGDLIAVPLDAREGDGVFNLDGKVVNHFNLANENHAVDFDGARLAWADRTAVHNEPYPYTPTTTGPPTGPGLPLPPAAKPAGAPSAKIAATRSVVRARSLKAFSGTAQDADGDLALVRVGLVRTAGKKCQTLQRSGALKTVARTGGKCIPTTFLKASGTARWKLKLRRRLPTGRYTLYAQAMDAAGHAQVVFTEAAGSLLTFRLK